MRKLSDTIDTGFWHIPNYRAKDIVDIDFKQLAEAGITKVAVDIDGTLLPGGSLSEIVGEFTEHIADARKRGDITRLVVATNRFPVISRKVGTSLKADSIVAGSLFTRKPSKRYYKALLAELGGPADETIMIGDKLLQDVFGSNRMGMHSLLVDDYGPEPWYDKILRRRVRKTKQLRQLEKELIKKS